MDTAPINPFKGIPWHMLPRAMFVWAQLVALWLKFMAFGDPEAEVYFTIDEAGRVHVVSAPEGFDAACATPGEARRWCAPLIRAPRRPHSISASAPRENAHSLAPHMLAAQARLTPRARDGPAAALSQAL